jgi:hypothetical protein
MSGRPVWVVGGWALANAVLVAVLAVGFHGAVAEVALYGAAIVIVTGFGAAVLLAEARGRVGQQRRQPVRSASMFLFAAACLLVGLGATYHWWIAAIAFYPLVAMLPLYRGERLAAGAPPVPASTTTETAPLADLAGVLPYTGSTPGEGVTVPPDHPARAAPRRVPHRSTRGWRWGLALFVLLRGMARAMTGSRRKRNRR